MSKLADVPALREMKNIGEGGGVHARLCRDVPVIGVLARKGGGVAARLGIADGPRQSTVDEMTILGIGPGRWLFLGRRLDDLAGQLEGLASLSDHSDGYALFEIWGSKVRDALAKGVPVDLHASVFSDEVAVTTIAHMGAILWRSGQDRFTIAIFRSYAGSFWHWLSASAAAFGLTAEDA